MDRQWIDSVNDSVSFVLNWKWFFFCESFFWQWINSVCHSLMWFLFWTKCDFFFLGESFSWKWVDSIQDSDSFWTKSDLKKKKESMAWENYFNLWFFKFCFESKAIFVTLQTERESIRYFFVNQEWFSSLNHWNIIMPRNIKL